MKLQDGPGTICIGACREQDLVELRSLMTELGYERKERELSTTVREIRQRGGEVFVAVKEDHVIGCVCALLDLRLAAGTYGEIVSLVVTEEFRGAGVGRVLVTHAESWLGERVGKIRVRANTRRKEAHGFYRSLGYEESKSQKIFIKQVP
ncbi:GNAT family N-acetyltransferase [Desulfopila sp. IMCC35008]|uniref:GNAT family N-acetyltransferase n=1 Tax=Desulfopila sp. IMCC35008 TaxID=2653858 RepID=UPI0013D0F602|nr:GNAT family N-acetyltransferase [Desulfopila sp. IMCC35008]